MDPVLLVPLLFWVLCLLPSSSSLLHFHLPTTYESVGGCYRSKVDKYPSKSPLFLGSSDRLLRPYTLIARVGGIGSDDRLGGGVTKLSPTLGGGEAVYRSPA